MIQLVGPGGAGKSTVGALLARRIRVRFIDLDRRFTETVGDISTCIDTHGYDAYAARNIDVYADIMNATAGQDSVLALSSGFMTYREDIHPEYVRHSQSIRNNPLTFVLLPSLELEKCVGEIVRRQLGRPFSRSPSNEEQVIRARFAFYRDFPTKKVQTMGRPAEAVEELLSLIFPAINRAEAWHRTFVLEHRKPVCLLINSEGKFL
jgi:shikimate kinase